MKNQRGAFTLLELLIVIAIITVLATLLFPLVGIVKFVANKAVTVARMQSVTKGLAELGGDEGTSGYLQANVFYEGVITFNNSITIGSLLGDPSPNIGSFFAEAADPVWTPGTVTTDYDDHVFNYPWGSPVNQATPIPGGLDLTTGPTACKITIKPMEHHVLRNLNPNQTLTLLHLSGVLLDEPFVDTNGTNVYAAGESYTDLNQNGVWDSYKMRYMGDRSNGRDFNDKWGHPFVVAYGFYQPGNAYDQTESVSAYQFSRKIYLSVAAAGPVVRNVTDQRLVSSTDSDWFVCKTNSNATTPSLPSEFAVSGGAGFPQWSNSPLPTTPDPTPNPITWMIWKQANQVCQQDKLNPEDNTWNENGFGNPPWQGIKDAPCGVLGHMEHCFLSAPLDLR